MRYIKRLPNLIAYYPMQEVEGTVCRNYAPATRGSLNGVIGGTVSLGNPGKVGRCYRFNSTNGQMVSIANNSLLDISGKISYIALLNLHSTGSFAGRIFDKASNLILYNGSYQQQNNGFVALSNSKSVDTDYMLCSSYDQTNVNFYVNGVLDKAVACTTNPQVNTTQMTLGNRSDGIRAADGALSHQAILSAALTPEQSRRIARIAGLI